MRSRKQRRILDSNKEEIRKEFGLLPQDKIFLTVSRVAKQKNHELMINSFSLLVEKRGDCRLVIVGRRRIARLCLKNRFTTLI